MYEYDLVIRGGELYDGSGRPPYIADVAVRGDRIAAIGSVTQRGLTEIDACGRIVTPGFVDIHTHYDGQAMWDGSLSPSSWHGVTTAVMGNCGVGFAPVHFEDRDRLIKLMEGVEDIPGLALHEGLRWNWESFPQYLDAIEARPHDIDFAAQIPHAPLRVFVMGKRAIDLEPATESDNVAMRKITQDAILSGAFGFSTSRTLNHRSRSGEPTPSLRATEDELLSILRGVVDGGGGVFEMISDFDSPGPDQEFAMVRRLVRETSIPTSVSLAQVHHNPNGWREVLDLVESAACRGLPIRAQVAPRPIGTLLGLQTTLNPFSAHPSYRKIATLPLNERVAILRQPDFQHCLLMEEPIGHGKDAVARFSNFTRVYPLGDPPNYEPSPEQSIASIAVRAGKPAMRLALDLLLEDHGRQFLFAPFSNYADGDLEACRTMMSNPYTIMGLGDGGAHVGMISDASFPTYLLTHWGRDRLRGRFALPELIRMQTRDTASAVGLSDRGILALGFKADINVIDFNRLGLCVPQMESDLPAGGKRLLQRASGYEATIVSGVIINRFDAPTGLLPGRLVRRKYVEVPCQV